MEGFCGVVLHLECFLVLWVEFPGDKSSASALPMLEQLLASAAPATSRASWVAVLAQRSNFHPVQLLPVTSRR